ncbi:hypothetical protein KY285_020568 [Solanum tuberosum]|nr:hypothetical protein KY285_020568 [Solanum tuberosum]
MIFASTFSLYDVSCINFQLGQRKQSQDSLNFVKLPDEGTKGPLCESHLDMVNLKTPISMDAQSNGGNHANLKNDSSDAYGSYCLAIDIDKRKFDAPKSIEEMNGNVKTDDYVSSMFQREISSLMGGKFMQQMMNNSFELPKFACKGKDDRSGWSLVK